MNVTVGRINEVAAITGFSYKKMYGHFARPKERGRYIEVAVSRGSTVHVMCVFYVKCRLSYLD